MTGAKVAAVNDRKDPKEPDSSYGIGTRVGLPFDAAVARVREELQKEGFGVLTEIDVKATLQKKLGVDFRRYLILGACNPSLAHRALSAELEIGLLLPCNLIAYETETGDVIVSAFDPMRMVDLVGRKDAIREVAAIVREKLGRVIAAVAAG